MRRSQPEPQWHLALPDGYEHFELAGTDMMLAVMSSLQVIAAFWPDPPLGLVVADAVQRRPDDIAVVAAQATVGDAHDAGREFLAVPVVAVDNAEETVHWDWVKVGRQ